MKPIEKEELIELVGESKVRVFFELVAEISKVYDLEASWNSGGKKWTYEYKLRKNGKTLCAFYFKEEKLGLMIIFGKEERARFEEIRSTLSFAILEAYDTALTFHDGKWVMLDIFPNSRFEEFKELLLIKRKPNRK